MGDIKKPSHLGHELDATHIDLGEDLLEKSALIEEFLSEQGAPPIPPDGLTSRERTADLLENAKILLSEGFGEDAKKILHKILIADPGNAVARRNLAEIHELELKQIFGESQIRRPYGRPVEDQSSVIFTESGINELLRKLDGDLKLDLTQNEGALSLFESQELLEDFCRKLEESMILTNSAPRDWLDLGIAFFEMELFRISEGLFSGAIRRIEFESTAAGSKQLLLSAHALLALVFLVTRRPFEVIRQLQPLLHDVEYSRVEKIELFYLMGRNYELMTRMELAYYYYQQVFEVDPHYRDIEQRLKAV